VFGALISPAFLGDIPASGYVFAFLALVLARPLAIFLALARSGLPMPEEILTNDPLQRRFQYRITAPMIREHLSTLDVLDLGDGTSLVVYSADADPATMALVIAGAAGNALEHLRDLMEEGR